MSHNCNKFRSGKVDLLDARSGNFELIPELVSGLTSQDFSAVGLSPKIPYFYSDEDSARKRLLERTHQRAYPRIISLVSGAGGPYVPVGSGMLMYLQRGPSLVERARSRLPGYEPPQPEPDNGRRTVSAWTRLSTIRELGLDVGQVATEIMKAFIDFATSEGLRQLDAQVVDEQPRGSKPSVMLVEHNVDLDGLGFERLGQIPLWESRRRYPGVRWRKELI